MTHDDARADPQDVSATAPVARGEGAWARLKRFLPLGIIAAGLGLGYAYGIQDFFTLDYLDRSRDMLKMVVADHPWGAPLGFGALYALAVAFSFPAASILTVFAGFLFGWLEGGLVVAFGATLGATMIFLAARSAFGDVLRQKIGGRIAGLAAGFEKDAFSYLLVLRLAPVFPFFVMNVAPALFRVPVRTYVIATFIGILPGTFAYAYLGEGVDSVIAAAKASGGTPSVGDLVTPEILAAFAILALAALLPTLIKRWRGRNSLTETQQ